MKTESDVEREARNIKIVLRMLDEHPEIADYKRFISDLQAALSVLEWLGDGRNAIAPSLSVATEVDRNYDIPGFKAHIAERIDELGWGHRTDEECS